MEGFDFGVAANIILTGGAIILAVGRVRGRLEERVEALMRDVKRLNGTDTRVFDLLGEKVDKDECARAQAFITKTHTDIKTELVEIRRLLLDQ